MGQWQLTHASAAGAQGPIEDGETLVNRVKTLYLALWKFIRPHTIRGTVLGTTAVTARALMENSLYIDWALLPKAVMGLVALLCGNGYIVGINQIYDVDIDTVNKPYLPIAAGELRPLLAWVFVLALAALGLWITATRFGALITCLYGFGLVLGTVYSIPPFRLKRFAIPAFLIIATVRGFLLNFGVYYATRAALKLSFKWSPALLFITTFVTVFATVIAITKDLPDVAGDIQYNIKTFATQLGERNIAFLGSGLLAANYVGAIALGLLYPAAFQVPLMVGGHMLFLAIIVWRTLRLDSSRYSIPAIQKYYAWIWNLFYAEYLLFPFI